MHIDHQFYFITNICTQNDLQMIPNRTIINVKQGKGQKRNEKQTLNSLYRMHLHEADERRKTKKNTNKFQSKIFSNNKIILLSFLLNLKYNQMIL